MPRQDVPYGGAICRLKERIAEIWDKLGEKLHSVNGVTGDAAGNVEIVSGDAAVVITSDQVNHEIEIALDSSQLPAAAVSSVNGQTGAVALDAGDIPSDGNSDVQTDINNLKTDVNANTSAIAAEALARANADSTLQGNINTLSASIPTAAATAVANDPTVAQLATDVPNKVDKITSGSSLKAYTHTGATQGETSVVDGTAANSIGLRDANGRMQAADPASGATDKTLTTANWVSQTGAGRPNNLLHDTGDEIKSGLFTLRRANLKGVILGANEIGYVRAYVGANNTTRGELAMIAFMSGKGFNINDANNWAIMIFNTRPYQQTPYNLIIPVAQGTFQEAGAYAMTFNNEGKPEIWVKITIAGITNHQIMSQILMQTSGSECSSDYFQEGDNAFYSEADFATQYPNAVYSS